MCSGCECLLLQLPESLRLTEMMQCSALTGKLGDKVITRNTPAFTSAQGEYWTTIESALAPACFVQPTSATDVSDALLAAKQYQCPFAVKSGGHTPFKGAANIDDGITIDLVKLNQVTVNNDGTVSVGPGNRWQDVYDALLPHKLLVVGARVGSVGVGGATLGGGISFLSGLHGFACDNVRNYQVVLADGCIEDINYESNPDLYWALRGGGSNFGIVTRFDMDSYPTGDLWGGMMVYNATEEDALVQAYYNLATSPNPDPKASSWLVFGYRGGTFLMGTEPIYTDAVAFPQPLQEITSIANLSAVVGFTNMSALVTQTLSPEQIRSRFGTATFIPDAGLMHYAFSRWRTLMAPYLDAMDIPTCDFQIINKPTLAQMQKRGGNALGLTEADGPLMLFSYNPAWKNATLDDGITVASRQLLDDVVAYGRERGLMRSYIYLNYAEPWADVFGSYGEENKERLLGIAEKYDPEGIFLRLQPGGIKLVG